MSVQLLKGKKYSGQYVALKSFEDATVISSGDRIQEVYEKAEKKGYKNPVIAHIPKKDVIQIY
ncbi:MAG: DUF5678 domain-containing protein [bacterium]|nr:DUF5678 domain-containing protein [bacterium]